MLTQSAKITSLKLADHISLPAIVNDYLAQAETLDDAYNYDPTVLIPIEGITNKHQNYNHTNRLRLSQIINAQYKNTINDFDQDLSSELVRNNIELLKDENTYTVTTGHQLQIFTGPLFFIAKIAQTIAYAKELNRQYPNYNIVPVYWLATEDHDFEEISTVNLFEHTLTWHRSSGGPVGRMNTAGLQELITQLVDILGYRVGIEELRNVLRLAYNRPTLADATRYLVNELFRDFGLVCIDADNHEFKSWFVPIMQLELEESFVETQMNETLENVLKFYDASIKPREINLFYLTDTNRSRIIKDEEGYYLTDGNTRISEADVLSTLQTHPAHFSPNVCLRPLYQEFILPNLAYIGGPSEVAYWLQLKGVFDKCEVTFPQVLQRHSFLFYNDKMEDELKQLHLNVEDLLKKESDLNELYFVNNDLKHTSLSEIQLIIDKYEELKNHIQDLDDKMISNLIRQINLHIRESKKWKNDISRSLLESQSKQISKLKKARQILFPHGQLQERRDNIIPYLLQYGNEIIEQIIGEMGDPEPKLHLIK
ncbi:MAG: bacillithiol biosynthesis cysteine-adding enzyme BshC [Bacteroidota bacterium]|nr:bacillithiol biosynthesis cysteine-adding enzyme BshC [Bacteroidota bacterium]